MKILQKILTISVLMACAVANSDICQQNSHAQSTEPCFDLQQFNYDLNKRAQVEKSVEFECHVQNKDSISIAWLHENQLISLNDQVLVPDSNLQLVTDSKTKFNLRIKSIDTSHKGLYRCQIISKETKNLEYNLDVLVPPTITRIPSSDVISLDEGDSITIQCITHGNPKPSLTWSKTGVKPGHTIIDEVKHTLTLGSVDQTHSDTYRCIAKNEVGNPVTSEFQVLVKFRPRVTVGDQVNMHQSVMYSAVDKKEHFKCVVKSYPEPKITLMHNDVPLSESSYSFEQTQTDQHQYTLKYGFSGGEDNFGVYKCVAENELGSSEAEVRVTGSTSDVSLTGDKLPIYSDAAVFEWSVYSGSPIQELNVQVFGSNGTNATNLVTKTRQVHPDGSESIPTYHNENVVYKDFFDLTKLQANSTYTVRLRVKNEMSEWSQWSRNLTVRTHSEQSEDKSIRHRSQIYNHRHHKFHKNLAQQAGSRDLSGKRFNTYFNSASCVECKFLFNLSVLALFWIF
ncbi:lachesin isoform X1 [Brachionus plicatilis]|uniref:Lachesin isoform X1 n=1 Tax=Brachionus plicatilis TaxID=10195 RepID=A0A3M7RKG0_BRAPC|nr:lachesin isoform X1 [Brachionus plicatilis]